MSETNQTVEASLCPVVLCFNQNFALPASVVIRSLLEASSDPARIFINVFTSGLDKGSKAMFAALASHFKAKIDIHVVDLKAFENLPLRAGFSHDAYSRLFAAEKLRSFRCFLYLDCDLLVEIDVLPLFDTDLSGRIAAAVPNADAPFLEEFNRKHGFALDTPVFNSGVLLVNTQKWIAFDAGRKIVEWITSNEELLIFRDQDGLNVVLHNEVGILADCWNVEARLYYEAKLGISDSWRHYENSPKIIHYTGSRKPWKPRVHVCGKWRYLKLIKANLALNEASDSNSRALSSGEKIDYLLGRLILLLSVARYRIGRLRRSFQ